VIEFLRKKNFDILDVKKLNLIGAPDIKILETSFKNNRVLITFDKALADIRKLKRKIPGIILLRIYPSTIEIICPILEKFLKEYKESFQNKIIVLTEFGYRERKL
jgi:predicted nuclease of predicted toxin-antitoxin system